MFIYLSLISHACAFQAESTCQCHSLISFIYLIADSNNYIYRIFRVIVLNNNNNNTHKRVERKKKGKKESDAKKNNKEIYNRYNINDEMREKEGMKKMKEKRKLNNNKKKASKRFLYKT